MISNKLIQAYNRAVENITRAVEKEIDSFEIDYDIISIQKFYIFIGDIKYLCYISKSHCSAYKYEISIFDVSGQGMYNAYFEFDIYTGLARINKLYKFDLFKYVGV